MFIIILYYSYGAVAMLFYELNFQIFIGKLYSLHRNSERFETKKHRQLLFNFYFEVTKINTIFDLIFFPNIFTQLDTKFGFYLCFIFVHIFGTLQNILYRLKKNKISSLNWKTIKYTICDGNRFISCCFSVSFLLPANSVLLILAITIVNFILLLQCKLKQF